MTTLADRVNECLIEKARELGITPQKVIPILAKYTGRKTPSIHDWINGGTKKLLGMSLIKASAFFNVNPQWLDDGTGPKRSKHTAQQNSALYTIDETRSPLFDWPLMTWKSAGLKMGVPEHDDIGKIIHVQFDSKPSARGFALQIKADSMIRSDGTGFPEGSYIAVEPARKPKTGNFVVVRFNGADESTFKQYIVDGPVKLLKPLNLSYQTLQLTTDAKLCGVVVEKRIVEKF